MGRISSVSHTGIADCRCLAALDVIGGRAFGLLGERGRMKQSPHCSREGEILLGFYDILSVPGIIVFEFAAAATIHNDTQQY